MDYMVEVDNLNDSMMGEYYLRDKWIAYPIAYLDNIENKTFTSIKLFRN